MALSGSYAEGQWWKQTEIAKYCMLDCQASTCGNTEPKWDLYQVIAAGTYLFQPQWSTEALETIHKAFAQATQLFVQSHFPMDQKTVLF